MSPEATESSAANSHHSFLALRYFPALDGLRTLSILPVVFHHATPRPFDGALGRGPLGVDLFFAISGFLITTLLLRELRVTGRVQLGAFYARRSLRIFPAYYVVLVAHVIYALLISKASPVGPHFLKNVPFFATYTTNWFVDFAVPHAVLFSYAWSLAVEEQFYAFWPGLVRLAGQWRGRAHLLLAATMTLLVAGDLALERTELLAKGSLFFRVATSFATPIGFGCLVALALDHPWSFSRVAPFLRHPAMRVALPALFIASFAVGIPLLLAFAVFALLVGSMALSQSGIELAFLSSSPMRFVGRISYSLYLTHVASLGLVRRLFPEHASNVAFVFLVGLPIALFVAALLHYWVERPIMDRWHSRYSSQRITPRKIRP